jgi:DNA mismatch repair protein MutL
MSIIRELPPQIAEKIAAGEVVNRPVSVVKELMENSLDAGAGSISVEIREGGKSLIRVTDDGSGIAPDQVEIAFRRHATSKISSLEDLDGIRTLGFRGEALTSIAAVSRLALFTKTRGEKAGVMLRMEGGRILERKQVGTADGTTVVVSDLFFNTPARLKFMKADRAESALIIDLASKIALAFPQARIRMINNDNILFATPGRGDLMANILTLYGRDAGEGLLTVEAHRGDMALHGRVSPPSVIRPGRKGQCFFINGRPVVSKLLERAVAEAYRETLFEGRHPIAFLFLDLPPERLDVNIHPAKSEVRFDDEALLEEFVTDSVRGALRAKAAIPRISAGKTLFAFPAGDLPVTGAASAGDSPVPDAASARGGGLAGDGIFAADAAQAGDSPVSGAASAQGGGLAPAGVLAADATQAGDSPASGAVSAGDSLAPGAASARTAKNEQIDIIKLMTIKREAQRAALLMEDADELPYDASVKEKVFEITAIRPFGVLFATYIAGSDGDSFYFIDQHAAHERILYEQILRQYQNREKLTQQLLTPLLVELPASLRGEDSLGLLAAMGYEAELFGPKTCNVRAVPAFLPLSEAEEFLARLLENMIDAGTPENRAAVERIISAACKKAVKARDHLEEEEILRLLADLSACENPYSCPHGRPIFLRMEKRDIEKLFKRL